MLNMPRQCPICGQDFMMEPGFYTGALWTSYPLVIATFATGWLVLYNTIALSSSTTLLAGSLVAVALQPPIMRMGRLFGSTFLLPIGESGNKP